MKIKGLTAIITGSTGQLGSALAEALAAAGCNCICHYRQNAARAVEIVKEIQALDVKAAAVKAELESTKAIEEFFLQTEDICGRIEIELPKILINSAAVFRRQPLSEVTFEDAQTVMGLNLIAPLMMSKCFAQMVEKRFKKTDMPVAKIVNIADVGGIKPWANYSVYCSSKAGLIGATKALAKELAPMICVNAVAPGIFSWPTDFDDEAKQRQLALIPMERIGTKEEIAAAVKFLLENDYITGEVLSVGGGRGL